MSAESLPNELLLEIFTFFPLKSLIAAQGVNRHWRQLVPLAAITPERKGLLALFMRAVSTDVAIKAISKLQHRSGFMDRWAWLASLESKIHSRWARATPGAVSGAASEAPDLISRTRLPDELRTWILEWPMKLIVWNWHPSEDSTKIFPDTGFFYPFDVGRAGCFGSTKISDLNFMIKTVTQNPTSMRGV